MTNVKYWSQYRRPRRSFRELKVPFFVKSAVKCMHIPCHDRAATLAAFFLHYLRQFYNQRADVRATLFFITEISLHWQPLPVQKAIARANLVEQIEKHYMASDRRQTVKSQLVSSKGFYNCSLQLSLNTVT